MVVYVFSAQSSTRRHNPVFKMTIAVNVPANYNPDDSLIETRQRSISKMVVALPYTRLPNWEYDVLFYGFCNIFWWSYETRSVTRMLEEWTSWASLWTEYLMKEYLDASHITGKVFWLYLYVSARRMNIEYESMAYN